MTLGSAVTGEPARLEPGRLEPGRTDGPALGCGCRDAAERAPPPIGTLLVAGTPRHMIEYGLDGMGEADTDPLRCPPPAVGVIMAVSRGGLPPLARADPVLRDRALR